MDSRRLNTERLRTVAKRALALMLTKRRPGSARLDQLANAVSTQGELERLKQVFAPRGREEGIGHVQWHGLRSTDQRLMGMHRAIAQSNDWLEHRPDRALGHR